MTANILTKAGVQFGTPEQLLSANSSNALGYFEHEKITYEVNDALLELFGGTWDRPPNFPPRWETLPKVQPIRDRATSIISELDSNTCWAWKDPRTSLLLPFWQSLIPDLRYVICLRNPTEVAKSLKEREAFSPAKSSRLWTRYIEDAINNTEDQSRLIVFYEDFFQAPETSISRLVEFAKNHPPSDREVLRLRESIFPELRHHKNSENDKKKKHQSKSGLLYKQLRASHGLREQKLSTSKPQKNHNTNKVSDVIDHPITFPKFETPKVSIVIPTFNRCELLSACLRSIWQSTTTPYQLIIVDDGSTDNTKRLLDSLVNVDVVTNETNLDFLHSANLGASEARGDYLVFLNNDVTVRAGWLNTLVNTIESQQNCGAVGARLISMDGKLQEAGCTVWPDGTVTLVGNQDDPFKPEYSYVREVDYCSGACLLLERKLFFQLGKFDTRFAPAYYEDVDMCMAIREAGKKVIYQPATMVFHHQMGSRPLPKVQTLLDRNRVIFRKKWQHVLAFRSSIRNSFFVRNDHQGKRVLVLSNTPISSDSAQQQELLLDAILDLAQKDYAISLASEGQAFALSKPNTEILQQAGVEVFSGLSLGIEKLLENRREQYDFVVYPQSPMTHITKLIGRYYPNTVVGGPELIQKLSLSGCNNG